MNKIIIKLFLVSIVCNYAFAKNCPAPRENSLSAFNIINDNQNNLCEYLEKNLVAKTARNQKCETMYHLAIKVKNYNAINCLDSINYGASNEKEVNRKDSKLGISIYEWSIKYGNIDLMNKYKEMGGDTDQNLLLLALSSSEESNYELVKNLINNGADVNKKGLTGLTPLMMASKFKSQQYVSLLIGAGADINSEKDFSGTALHFAARYNTKEVIETLLRAGADIHAKAVSYTVLHYATIFNNKETVETLIRAGADIYEKNSLNQTALLTASGNKKNVVELLVNSGANLSDKDSSNRNSLYIASQEGQIDTMKYLIDHGVDVNTYNSDKRTVLHLYAGETSRVTKEYKLYERINILINAGADLNAKNSDGLTPYQVALKINPEDEKLLELLQP